MAFRGERLLTSEVIRPVEKTRPDTQAQQPFGLCRDSEIVSPVYSFGYQLKKWRRRFLENALYPDGNPVNRWLGGALQKGQIEFSKLGSLRAARDMATVLTFSTYYATDYVEDVDVEKLSVLSKTPVDRLNRTLIILAEEGAMKSRERINQKGQKKAFLP